MRLALPILFVLGALLTGCDAEGSVLDRDAASRFDAGPPCTPTSTAETACSDGIDEDCDGYRDCLDTDCEAISCGAGALACTGGACVAPCSGADCLPPLPPIENLRPTVRGDTAIVEFEPVAGARDYRIYRYPEPGDVSVGADGELSIRNAIYRCAGMRPLGSREANPSGHFDASLSCTADACLGYARSEPESILGWVFLTPAAGRSPVYRMADPNGAGGFFNSDWVVPLFADANAAEYVVGTAERDRLLAAGYRDDGIAFYVADEGTRPVYRARYEPDWLGDRVLLYFVDGPEHDARSEHDGVLEMGEAFRILDAPVEGAVELHRVYYLSADAHDVLAAGDARYERVLHQGNVPLTSVTWPGLTEEGTYVIEALDSGCPFPGGYIGAVAAPADPANRPTITLDEARLSSGEVFVNGQFTTTNRPRPIARALVTLGPAAEETMGWLQTFDPGAPFGAFDVMTENNGVFIYRNDVMGIDFSGCSENLSVGPLLGQLRIGFADYGSSCNMSIFPRDFPTSLEAERFLHVRMSSDIPSTGRRYPQLMITTVVPFEPIAVDGMRLWERIFHHRLGPLPADLDGPDMMRGTPDDGAPGEEVSIIVQPFGGYHELQIQICDQRGWGVGNQCSQANLYGHHAGNYLEEWDEPWLPVPVMGEISGHDRPVRFDVYASTERVYVYVDGRPAGCAVLPAGRMPAGPVTPSFRAVLYHSDIDESVTPEDTAFRYLRDYSLMHTMRSFDDLGVDEGVAAPAWDESILPCGTRWYGGE